MSLAETMEVLNADVLKALAKQLGLPRTLTRKADLSRAMEQYVDKKPDAFLGQLSDGERLFLAEAAHHGGRVSPRVFHAKHQVPAPRTSRWAGKGEVSLTRLLVQEDEDTGDVCIPKDWAERLRSLLPKPPEATVTTVGELPTVLDLGDEGPDYEDEKRPIHVFEGEKTVFAELRRVLNLIQAGKLRVQDKSRRPTDATVRLLAGCLVVPDFDLELPKELRNNYTETAGSVRAHAWAVLVQQCGWAKPHAGRLVLTKTGKELLGNVPLQEFRDGLQHFLGDDQFDELNRINHIRGQSGRAKRDMTPPSERRDAISDSMSLWPVGRWIPFGEAFRVIDASDNCLNVTDDPYDLYFCEQQYGSLGDAGDDIERQYLRAFLMESLSTLGVVDIAYVYPQGLWPELSDSWGIDDMEFCGRYDGLLYVRLSALGAYCLGLAESYQPPAAERRSLLKVLPNRELAIHGGSELSPADRCTLELFAKQKGDHLWSLDPQSILDYIESGGSVEDVSRFLSQNADGEIPHTVEVFLSDLAGKLNAVQGVERAILVEMKDAEVAARVAHDRQTKSLCRLAGDRHLAVPEKNEQAFRTAIKKLGYVLPR
jgi:hypothetical protein